VLLRFYLLFQGVLPHKSIASYVHRYCLFYARFWFYTIYDYDNSKIKTKNNGLALIVTYFFGK